MAYECERWNTHFSGCLTHAVFSPELPITAQVPVVLVSLALPSALPALGPNMPKESISLTPTPLAC